MTSSPDVDALFRCGAVETCWRLGGLQRVDRFREPRLVSSRGILRDDALLNGLVDQAERRRDKSLRVGLSLCDSGFELPHLSFQLMPVRGIDRFALFTLPVALQCRWVICHELPLTPNSKRKV